MTTPERYAPGWTDDVLAMLSGRTAEDRGASVLANLSHGMRVLDVGCGPGTITIGLARAVGPTGRVVGVDRELSQVDLARRAARAAGAGGARFVQGSVYAIPLADDAVDVVVAHALFEHLAEPARALAELRRVVRDGGLVALTSSDWGGARLDPWDRHVDLALRAHVRLRRRAGGDPHMGRRLEALARDAGLVDVRVSRSRRVDMGYGDLARYVRMRIEAAAAAAETDGDRTELRRAADAAARWAASSGQGTFEQCWVEVVARCPQPGSAD